MSELDTVLTANARTPAPPAGPSPIPRRRVAVVTCMDARIDVAVVLGLGLGEGNVIRNAGARVTDDVERSLTLAAHALGVDTVLVMHHTGCALATTTEAELRASTGSEQDFLVIHDHAAVLHADVARLAASPTLAPVTTVAGLLYHLDTGRVDEVARWERNASGRSG